MFTLTIEDANGQIADRFTFDHGAYVVGRHESCDIVIPSSAVSRQHARIFVDNGRCFVEDLGSANGVIVDGQRVLKQRDLGSASQIKIGDFYLYLEFKRPESNRANLMQTLFINDNGGHHKIVRINDAFAGEEFGLSEVENTIGRTDENFILLSDTSISRLHAKVVRQGDSYSVIDLGSSNGTRVNGKLIKALTPLKVGDRVHFGNIEFVFVDGNTHVNPADYSTSPANSGLVIHVGLGVLLLLGIAVGAVVVYGFATFQKQDTTATQTLTTETIDAKVEQLLASSRKKIEQRDFQAALSQINDALALLPDHAEAQTLKASVNEEVVALNLLEEGERLLERGRHEEARETLLRIGADTDAHARAIPTLKHISSSLAYKFSNEALRLSRGTKKDEWIEAHEKAKRALEYDEEDTKTIELIKEIEAKLTKERVPFEPYSAVK